MHFVGILPLSWRRINQFRGSSIGHGGRSAVHIPEFLEVAKWVFPGIWGDHVT